MPSNLSTCWRYRSDEQPDFINLNPLAGQVAERLVLLRGAGAAFSGQPG
jgi:hypothetical protein